jgi:hypothetical protein
MYLDDELVISAAVLSANEVIQLFLEKRSADP